MRNHYLPGAHPSEFLFFPTPTGTPVSTTLSVRHITPDEAYEAAAWYSARSHPQPEMLVPHKVYAGRPRLLLDNLPWVSRFLRKPETATGDRSRYDTKLQGQERSFQGKYLSWSSLPPSATQPEPRTYESQYFAKLLNLFRRHTTNNALTAASKANALAVVSRTVVMDKRMAMYEHVARSVHSPAPQSLPSGLSVSTIVPVLHPTSAWDTSTAGDVHVHSWNLFDTSSLRCIDGKVVTIAKSPGDSRLAVCPSFARVGFTIDGPDPDHALACHAAGYDERHVFCMSPGLVPFTVFNTFTNETERKIQVTKSRQKPLSTEEIFRYFHRALAINASLDDKNCPRLLPAPAISASFELSGATNKYMVLRLNHVTLPPARASDRASSWFPQRASSMPQFQLPIYVRAIGSGSPSMLFSQADIGSDIESDNSLHARYNASIELFRSRLATFCTTERATACGLAGAVMLEKPCALPVDAFYKAVCCPDEPWTEEKLNSWAYDEAHRVEFTGVPVSPAEPNSNMYDKIWQDAYVADKTDMMMVSQGLTRHKPDRLTLMSPSPLFYDLAPCMYPKTVTNMTIRSQPLVIFTRIVLTGSGLGASAFSNMATLFCEQLRAAFVEDDKLSLLTVTHGPGTTFIPMGLSRIRHVAKATVGRSLCKTTYAKRDGKVVVDKIDVEQSEATEHFHRRMTLDALPDALRTTRAAHDIPQHGGSDEDVPVTISYVGNRPEESYESDAKHGLTHLLDAQQDRITVSSGALSTAALPRARFSEFAQALTAGVVRPDLHAFHRSDAAAVSALGYSVSDSSFFQNLKGTITQWDDLMSFFTGDGGRMCCADGWIEHGLIRREILVTGALAHVRQIGYIFAEKMQLFASELPSTSSRLRQLIIAQLSSLVVDDRISILSAARQIRLDSAKRLSAAAREDRFPFVRLIEYARRTMETVSMLPWVVRPDHFDDATPLDVAALLRCCAPLFRSVIGGMLERVDAAGPAWWTPRQIAEARAGARSATGLATAQLPRGDHRDAWRRACVHVEQYAFDRGLFVADAARLDETSYNNSNFYHLVAAVAAAMCRPQRSTGTDGADDAIYPQPVRNKLRSQNHVSMRAGTQRKAMWRCADRIAQQGMILSATDHQERSTEVVELVKTEIELMMDATKQGLDGEDLRVYVYRRMLDYINLHKFEVDEYTSEVNYKNPRGLPAGGGQSFINSRRLLSRTEIVKHMVDVWNGNNPTKAKNGIHFSRNHYSEATMKFIKPFVPQIMFFAARPEVASRDFCARLVDQNMLKRETVDRFYEIQASLPQHGYASITIPKECIRTQLENMFEVYDVYHNPDNVSNAELMNVRIQNTLMFLVPVANYDGIIHKIVKEQYADKPVVLLDMADGDPAHISNTLLKHLVDAEYGRATVFGARIITINKEHAKRPAASSSDTDAQRQSVIGAWL